MLWYLARASDLTHTSQAGWGGRVICPNDPASGNGALEAPVQGSHSPFLMDFCAGRSEPEGWCSPDLASAPASAPHGPAAVIAAVWRVHLATTISEESHSLVSKS